MKELTEKEKAERYNEAFKIAQELYNNPNSSKIGKEWVCAIFPELKESGDERIRQYLIKCFTGTEDCAPNIKGKDIIAWLEKQGTPAKLSEEEQNKFAKGVLSSCAMSFVDYLDAHKYEGKMCVSNGECEDIENSFHNAMWDRLHRYYCKYIEKQGEQKPVTDFSDLRTWKYIVDAVWTEKEGIGQYLDNPFTEEIAKKLQKRFGNIEQKPTEWSEEDEKTVHLACEFIRHHSRKGDSIGGIDCTELIKMLKSLRHHSQWKPSEEQMKALNIAIRCGIQLGSSEEIALKGLLEQLKKL